MKHYQGEPGQTVRYGGVDGEMHSLKADDDGVLTAKTAGDEAILEGFGLSEVKKQEAKKTATAPAKED